MTARVHYLWGNWYMTGIACAQGGPDALTTTDKGQVTCRQCRRTRRYRLHS